MVRRREDSEDPAPPDRAVLLRLFRGRLPRNRKEKAVPPPKEYR